MAEPTVLYLLPGLLCDQVVWTHQMQGVADLAEPDVPGFYGFDSILEMAQSVLAKAPPRFSLAGHSMGARVALEIVRIAPQRVERLALLDTGTHAVRPGEQEKRENWSRWPSVREWLRSLRDGCPRWCTRMRSSATRRSCGN